MKLVQTDNSYFADKVMLRLNNLPGEKTIRVLDAFAGEGRIWDKIKTRSNKQIIVTSIEQKRNKKGVYLKGDNVKYLKTLNLSYFDVIDLDTYGIPFKQLEEIFAKQTHCVVFVTFIQSAYGRLPYKLLNMCGYSKEMIRKTPILFMKNGMDKMKIYLAQKGIKKIKIRSAGRKHYLTFKT